MLLSKRVDSWLDLWYRALSYRYTAALPYVGVRRAPERKSPGSLLNPRNASRDPISTNPDGRPGISIASVPVDYTTTSPRPFPVIFYHRTMPDLFSRLVKYLRKISTNTPPTFEEWDRRIYVETLKFPGSRARFV